LLFILLLMYRFWDLKYEYTYDRSLKND